MLWYGIMFLFVTGSMFSFLIDGRSGIAATTLSAAVNTADLYLPITSSNGFASSDTRVFIEDEEIAYDSIQTTIDGNCAAQPCLVVSSSGRGYNDTEAASHASGIKVLSETAGLVNQGISFRVGNVDTTWGKLTFPFQAISALAKFVGKAILWDYSFLEGNAIYFKLVLLYPLSMMMVIALLRIFTDAASRFL
tara:strand:+ start:97 stop:675 length:579 start_codon:yes stop_codon:yes gene_type:complete